MNQLTKLKPRDVDMSPEAIEQRLREVATSISSISSWPLESGWKRNSRTGNDWV